MWDFVAQFNALAWKNYKLKLRAWSVLLLELLVPTLIILALASSRTVEAGDGSYVLSVWFRDECG